MLNLAENGWIWLSFSHFQPNSAIFSQNSAIFNQTHQPFPAKPSRNGWIWLNLGWKWLNLEIKRGTILCSWLERARKTQPTPIKKNSHSQPNPFLVFLLSVLSLMFATKEFQRTEFLLQQHATRKSSLIFSGCAQKFSAEMEKLVGILGGNLLTN